MLSQSHIKSLKSLHQKKYRQQKGEIILEGHRLIKQALLTEADLTMVWMTSNYAESPSGRQLKQKLTDNNIAMETSSEKSIQKVCDSQNSQGVIALMPLPKYEGIQNISRQSLYLDNIADPGNMGTLLRTATWFGIDSVFLSVDCVDPWNSKVLRSAMGAHFYLQNLLTIPHDKLFEKYMSVGYAILGADMHGESVKNIQMEIEKGWILILSSEAHGMRDSLRAYINHSISIPGFGGMESLNVAVAGGILLHGLTSSMRLLQTEKK
ncbi:uncharacterized protein METZ01_LOCUS367601 [marine metagenome]|uniref:RNA 2-O ribose methyltransferase substrate binding domain-containing protein n=1 Tax=marine metagenome TaxID=408172 RepID=A0A382SZS3_9ZZZZ